MKFYSFSNMFDSDLDAVDPTIRFCKICDESENLCRCTQFMDYTTDPNEDWLEYVGPDADDRLEEVFEYSPVFGNANRLFTSPVSGTVMVGYLYDTTLTEEAVEAEIFRRNGHS